MYAFKLFLVVGFCSKEMYVMERNKWKFGSSWL
jgi:hypothetical protein